MAPQKLLRVNPGEGANDRQTKTEPLGRFVCPYAAPQDGVARSPSSEEPSGGRSYRDGINALISSRGMSWKSSRTAR
ncbi:MAG: hypothetical protein J2P21_15035 [Chloracidobacterium sp.]|nr:hypothetical protein [Chloracidobacterium sp.]